jgi:hypothetical protein
VMVMKMSVIWDITTCSLLKVSQVLLATYSILVSWLAYSLTLIMEVSDMSLQNVA